MIQPGTWKKLNGILAKTAVKRKQITGEQLRLDTTAVETDIHWPTDSSLLWDGFRTLAKFIVQVREIHPAVVGNRRLHRDRVKRLYLKSTRKAHAKNRKASDLKPLYKRLICQVEGVCDWTEEIVSHLEKRRRSKRKNVEGAMNLAEELSRFAGLSRHVIWQATERVIHGKPVSN